ncbi:unnamed protein product [Gongylonema pulchrum]|uniref:Skp1_POZ domain-containing protein n=1 Tax=Gongylonema pulchrum TaxID=637853 RepID=A0A183EZL8_9BILA|nr:unnamed protein product [Gongylonema pulchrum]
MDNQDGGDIDMGDGIPLQNVNSSILKKDGGDIDMGDGIPLQNVNSSILKKVIQWCQYHKDDPIPPDDSENKEKRTDDIPSWDVEFLKVDQGTLFELILASAYLFLLKF